MYMRRNKGTKTERILNIFETFTFPVERWIKK